MHRISGISGWMHGEDWKTLGNYSICRKVIQKKLLVYDMDTMIWLIHLLVIANRQSSKFEFWITGKLYTWCLHIVSVEALKSSLGSCWHHPCVVWSIRTLEMFVWIGLNKVWDLWCKPNKRAVACLNKVVSVWLQMTSCSGSSLLWIPSASNPWKHTMHRSFSVLVVEGEVGKSSIIIFHFIFCCFIPLGVRGGGLATLFDIHKNNKI